MTVKNLSYRLFWLLVLLCIFGSCLSVYYITHFQNTRYGFAPQPSFCNINAIVDCDEIQFSRDAVLLGQPIGTFSLLFFLIFIQLLAFHYKKATQITYWGLRGWSGLGFLVALQKIIALIQYQKVCITCVSGHIILITLALLVWLRIKRPVTSAVISPPTVFRQLGLSVILILLSFWVVPNLTMDSKGREGIQAIRQWVGQIVEQGPTPFPDTIILNSYPGGDYTLGNPTAPIQIISFHDFECPYCREMSKVFKRIRKRFKNQVHFVMKNHPMDHNCHPEIDRPMHLNACKFAQIARCAGRQKQPWFWDAYSFINSTPPADITTEALAQAIPDLSVSKLGTCLESNQELTRIETDIYQTSRLAISYNPTFFVNGHRIQRYLPFYALEVLIERLLASTGK